MIFLTHVQLLKEKKWLQKNPKYLPMDCMILFSSLTFLKFINSSRRYDLRSQPPKSSSRATLNPGVQVLSPNSSLSPLAPNRSTVHLSAFPQSSQPVHPYQYQPSRIIFFFTHFITFSFSQPLILFLSSHCIG